MNLPDATNLIHEYINKFIPGTKFAGFTNSKVTLGSAGLRGSAPFIKISKPFVLTASEKSIRNTIAHECAHILSYHKFGTLAHDQHFYNMCKVTGADAERCSEHEINNEALKGTYGLVIIDNDEVVEVLNTTYHRRPRLDMSTRFLSDKPKSATLGKLHYCKLEDAKIGTVINKNNFWQK